MRSPLTLALVIGALGPACESAAPAQTADSPSRQRAVASIAENVMLPNYRAFSERAAALETAIAAWNASGSEADHDGAKVAWRAAFESWQRTELHQLGPAGMNNAVPGGMDLRDEIYSWPLVNRCRVDQETTETAYASKEALAAEAVNVRGLAAIEYLLFAEGTGNACAVNASLNTSGAWTALGDEGVRSRRRAYAETASALVHDAAERLVTAWEPSGGDFVGALKTAGSGGSLFTSSQTALNAISDALLYFESAVKDMKLATPGGLSTECAVTTCPDRLESPIARVSKEGLVANIRAFRELFEGGPDTGAFGFDDLLTEAGAEALAAQIHADLDAAEAAAVAVPGTFEEALAPGNTSGRDAFIAVHTAVKKVTDELKTEFLTVLDLSLPQRLESDND